MWPRYKVKERERELTRFQILDKMEDVQRIATVILLKTFAPIDSLYFYVIRN